MPATTPPETLELIRKLAGEGQSSGQIGSVLGKSAKAVQHLFRKYNIANRGRGNAITYRPPVHGFDEQAAIALYLSGKTYQEIAEHFQIQSPKPSEVVRRRLRKLGVESRVGKADLDKNHFWKGGHHEKNEKSRNRYECYRTVVAYLGVLLPEGWVVHHLDENPANNNLSNLCLFPSETAHAKHHSYLLENQFAGDSAEAIQLALRIGGHLLQPLPGRNAVEPDRGLLALLETELARVGPRTKWQFLAGPKYQPRKPLPV